MSANPTLICARAQIGHVSPNKAGGHDVHGAPLGATEVQAVREALDWPHPPFVVPDAARARGAAAQARWQARLAGCRAALPDRVAALMRPPVYLFTHDSIDLGEDGPAHQPVEQLATLRLVPDLDVWRPGDAVQTLVAWQTAIRHLHTPTCLVLSRQNLPHQERDMDTLDVIRRSGHVLVREAADRLLQLVLIAAGSALDLAGQARRRRAEGDVNARVVSMPSCFVFEQQEAAWCRASPWKPA